jgi:cell wall-associated NlpC family hydrolase
MNQDQSAIVTCLERQFGVNYLPQGDDPDYGFDSSGLTKFCFGEAGIELEHGAAAQASSEIGVRVDCTDAAPGDLVFYNSPVSFVGTFRTGTDVIQVADTAGGVKLYRNIFANDFYGPKIAQCKRMWRAGFVLPYATTPARTREQTAAFPSPTATPAATLVPLPLCPQQRAVLTCLVAELGQPYVAQGDGSVGWDNGTLVQHCFREAGIELPSTPLAQSQVAGLSVECSAGTLLPGDLVFIDEYLTGIDLVATIWQGSDAVMISGDSIDTTVRIYFPLLASLYYQPRIRRCLRVWTCPPPTPSSTPTVITWQQSVILACLEDQVGKPWAEGGVGPDSFDASGLTQYCFGRAGIALPHGSAAQAVDPRGRTVD